MNRTNETPKPDGRTAPALPEPLLVKSDEAARLLNVSARTLWGLADRGEIPRVLIGSAVRFDPRDLRRWIEASKTGVAPTATDGGQAA